MAANQQRHIRLQGLRETLSITDSVILQRIEKKDGTSQYTHTHIHITKE